MKQLLFSFFIIIAFSALSQSSPLKKSIYFERGSYDLSQQSLVTMFEMANMLKESPSYTLVLTGHTDNTGNAAANQKLSEYRVGAVRNYLLQLGLKNEWMSVDFFGANQPASSNDTEDSKHYNRRVEISVFYYPPSEPAKIKSEVVVPSHRQKSTGEAVKHWD